MKSRLMAMILIGIVAIAAAIVLVSRDGYAQQDRELVFAGSSTHHPAGTDGLGRDRLVRVATALVLSLGGALAAAAATTCLAAGMGTLAAFSPALLGKLAMLLCDVFLALPWLFLLMIVRSELPLTTSPGYSAAVTFFVLAALGWPACARAIYRGALNLRTSEWMLYCRAAGLRRPQTVPPCDPKHDSPASPAIPDLRAVVRHRRSQSGGDWPGHRRAPAFMGRNAA